MAPLSRDCSPSLMVLSGEMDCDRLYLCTRLDILKPKDEQVIYNRVLAFALAIISNSEWINGVSWCVHFLPCVPRHTRVLVRYVMYYVILCRQVTRICRKVSATNISHRETARAGPIFKSTRPSMKIWRTILPRKRPDGFRTIFRHTNGIYALEIFSLIAQRRVIDFDFFESSTKECECLFVIWKFLDYGKKINTKVKDIWNENKINSYTLYIYFPVFF